MASEKILIVDDETTIQYVLATLMTQLGHAVETVGSAEDALARINAAPYALAMVDIVLPGMSGIALLGQIKVLSPETEVIMMTSHASIDTALEALRKGAYGYVHKPFELDDVTTTVERALEKRHLTTQNRRLLKDQERRNQELIQAVKRLRSLNAAGNAMSGIATLPELLDFFVGLVADELDVERVSLMLKHEGSDDLTVAASRGLPPNVAQTIRVQMGQGISGRVAKDAVPMIAREFPPDAASGHSSYKTDSFVSVPIVLSVPIRTPQAVLGVINVTDRRDQRPFDDDDTSYLSALAGQVGVAIERASQGDRLRGTYESLRSAQDQVVAASRLKALGEMAAGVAHDFNNVLNGILGRAQLIRVCLQGPHPQVVTAREYADTVEMLSLQGAETVRRIQEFARIRKDRPNQFTDLNDAVRLAVDLTRPKWSDESRARNVPVEVALDLSMVPPITGSAQEVGQIISNLVFNAVEAMAGGGLVTIKTHMEGDSVRLIVSDTGSGMSEEVRSRVFEPFFTTKANGQGLGMSVVYGIVQRMGGEIFVESVEGRGTTITVALCPTADRLHETTPARQSASTAAASTQRKSRVMLVDDDPNNLQLCQDFLANTGHEVVTASSGSEALIELRERGANLVVTDLSMPGMSGLELAKTIHSSMPGVRVVMLSGWAVQQEDDALREAGILRVLAKPIGMDELIEAVEAALAA